MSSAAPVTVLTRILRLVRQFGPGALRALHTILSRAKSSGDPELYLKRLAKAEGVHAATQQAVKEALRQQQKN